MVFSSLEFLFLYFAASIMLYFIVPLAFRNVVLLIVSLAFYGWGEPIYVTIMLFSIIVDYICGYFVGKYREVDKKKARRFVITSAVINLGILGFFKYYTFIVSNLQLLPFAFLQKIPLLADVKLPIGISFYTFQTMSYTIDIYRGDAKVQRNIASFGAYVTLFPQLIAGPIVRYQDVDDQLRSRPHNIALFASGMRTFICGMAKKILLANCAGAMWEGFQALSATDATVVGAWLGMLFYAFQIYFDFSGYSDMAIGIGKMLGFQFKENFFYPYVSKSITEFWRRWHISMGTWFREYVYIPLGGNRCSKLINLRNIVIVWLLTGFWHGASWNYVLWGVYYCIFLMMEKLFLQKILQRMPGFVSHLYTLVVVLFGWWLFVFEDLSAGVTYLGYMFGHGVVAFSEAGAAFDLLRSVLFLAILCIASTPLPKRLFYKLYEKGKGARVAISTGSAVILVLCTAYLVDSSYNPFLYFRF
ncbi:MAG: MBOAT family protein [Clostridiales bacterium]|jgi:alginate O-acetyltransferase complex protein AlgI|nr:MBOAT family protein [Clostridiales bacterium]